MAAPVLTLVGDPWANDPTLPENLASVEIRREEQRREERLREDALRLMGERRVATFAEALEMVREGRV
jgi:hypothetical protein